MSIEQIVKGSQNLKSPQMGIHKGYSLKFDTVKPDDSLGKAFQSLSKVAAWATQAYKEEPEEDKSKQLFASLPLEKQRELMNGGDVGIEVNNTTMKNLKMMYGQLSANDYMTGLYQQVQDGHIKTLDEVQQAYQQGYKSFMSEQARKYGINDLDQDYLKGYSQNVHSGMMQMMALASSKFNDKTKAEIEFNYVQRFNKMSRDNAQGLMDGTVADMTWSAVRDGIDTLKIPTDEAGLNVINQVLTNSTQSLGGYKFLEDSRNQIFTIGGKKGTLEEHIGKDKYELLIERSKSYQTDYTTSQGANMARELALVSNPNSEMSPEERVAIVDKWQQWTNTWFPSEKNNQYRNQLKQATISLDNITIQQIAGLKQQNLKKSEEQAKDHAYVSDLFKVMNGAKGIPLLAKNRPEYNENDILRGAGLAIQQVKQMPPEEQPKMFAKMLAADQLGGGVAAMLKGDFEKAQREFESNVANGVVPESMPNFEWAYGIYSENPQLVMQHYPDLIPMFSKMNLMNTYGYDRNKLIENEINKKTIKDSGQERKVDMDYETALKDNKWSSDYPASSMSVAKDMFMSTLASSGSTELAVKATDEFLKSSTWQYEDPNKGFWKSIWGGNDVYGRITRDVLRVNDDPESYKIGAEALTSFISEIKSMTNDVITVKQNGDNIDIYSHNGSFSKTIRNEDLVELVGIMEQNKIRNAEVLQKQKATKASERLDLMSKTAKTVKEAKELTKGMHIAED